MNRTIFRTSLDIHDIYSQFTLPIKRGDTSGRLIISLTERGKPYQITERCYAVFAAVKEKSGATLHNSCIVQNNTIIYDFTEVTTSTAERLNSEIILYSEDGDTLLSPRFTIVVHDSAFSEAVVEGSNEYNSLRQLVSAANVLVQDVSTKLENGEFVGDKGAYDFYLVQDETYNVGSYIAEPKNEKEYALNGSRNLTAIKTDWNFIPISLSETAIKYIEEVTGSITSFQVVDATGEVKVEQAINFGFDEAFYSHEYIAAANKDMNTLLNKYSIFNKNN